ncbi:SMP-30/gluconolactonase/LRE family protein [Aquimarina mytili]|uniref:SMP-30/gluconolactonase/LRE family protein n=1 Tax=Aquimarina mytili TaxID=874423 RepID=A0A936ZXG4_9FLAO|nr:SMP-30/gluconolactonase/LRE family protein [Aquimarina mytili]MBL0684051.1 SMP-30/gluconolactonase/LRE family protein [Aquimarina mytili]
MQSIPSFAIIILFSIGFIFKVPAQNLNNSNIAFTVPEKDLLPESIAYDSIKNEFYIGSTRKGKIIKISKDGLQKDFILPKQAGLWMIIGIKIDANRRHLWVCSSGGDNLIGYTRKDDKEGRPSGIFKFNLDTGKLIKKYVLDIPGEVHFFNDLEITKSGDVYITHMFSEHALYKIAQDNDQLKKVMVFDDIKYPNGLALSNDEAKLYIAHSDGISVMDLADKNINIIGLPEGLKIARKESIDGLYFYDNSLIGIQPDINTVQQLVMNKSGTEIIEARPLEINHPMMNNPTTGELVNDMFYYVANAQFGSFNEDGSLFSKEKLYEVCILKLHLKK